MTQQCETSWKTFSAPRFLTQSRCDYYKPFEKTCECAENKMCKYQNHCCGTGTCDLRSGSERGWSICDTKVLKTDNGIHPIV